MRIDLSDKQAVVSGSTAGIGYAIAEGLAAAGAHVIINGRNQETVLDAARRLGGEVQGAAITGVAADLGTAEGVQAFATRVRKPISWSTTSASSIRSRFWRSGAMSGSASFRST